MTTALNVAIIGIIGALIWLISTTCELDSLDRRITKLEVAAKSADTQGGPEEKQ